MKTRALYLKSIFLPKFPKISFRKLIIFEVSILSGLLLSLCFQIGILTKDFYIEKKYKRELESLSKEIEELEITLAKESSLSQIKNYFSDENFVKAKPYQIKYFQILEETFVRSK